ncbi:MAG TPA: hypothetical protein VGI29_12415 [Candidatus Binataceae bacterium]
MSGYAVILLAYAQVAATLTGFIGVVFVFGERSHRLGKGQSSALFHFMYASLSALFLSLFAAALLVYAVSEEHIAWQICNALSGLIHLIGGGRLALEASQHRTEVLRSSAASATGLGTAAVSFLAAAGYLTREEALIFMLATLWTLGVTIISFVSLLVSVSSPSVHGE